MPVFLVPAVIGAATLISGVTGGVLAAKFDKRKKIVQAKLDDVQEKSAILSHVRLMASVTLGDAAKLLKKNNPSKHGNTEKSGLTPTQISDLQNRSETAAQVLQTISGYGAGAAGVSATWVAASLGTASTGAPISGLFGAAATSAKLAWFGGGALAVGGGGMTLGGIILGGLPIGIGMLTVGVISMFSAKKFENVELMADLLILRIDELIGATEQLDHALQQLLAQNPSDVEVVESVSGILAQVIDIPIADEDGNILNEDVLKDTYRTHLLSGRRDELSKAYRRLRDAVAIQAYDNMIRTAKHILSIILLKSPKQQRQRPAA